MLTSRIADIRHRLRPGGLGRDTMWAIALEVAGVVSMLVGFGIVSKSLGAAGYGGYIAVFAIVNPMAAPAYGGLILGVLHHAVREREDLGEVAASAMSLSIVLGILFGLAGLYVARHLVRGVPMSAMALIIVAEMMILPIIQTVSAVVQAAGPFPQAMQIRIAPPLMRITGLIALRSFGGVSLTTVGASLIYCYLAVCVPAIWYGQWTSGVSLRPGRIRLSHIRSSFTYGTGMSALSAQNDGDKVALNHYGFGAAGGQYGAAYRLVQLGFVPINALLSSSHMRFLVHDESAKDQHVRRAARFTLVSLAYGAVVCLVTVVVAPLIPVVLGEEYRGSVNMIRLLSPLVLMRSVGMFALNGVIGLGRSGLRTWLLVFGAVMSIGLYVALVPGHSWKGAVVGTLISETVLALVAWAALVALQRRHNRGVEHAGSASLELVEQEIALEQGLV